MDWLSGKVLVERGIVCQQVDEVKTSESRKRLVIDGELLTSLQTWKQVAQFSAPERLGLCFPVPARSAAMVL